VTLRPVATGEVSPPANESSDAWEGNWELICRDGWDWRRVDGGVLVRVATLSAAQASVVQEWLDRIREPAVWWAVSRELQAPDSDREVAGAMRLHPWLGSVLPVLLEASTEGAPPPPPGASGGGSGSRAPA
jgi:hypothetical protein